MTISHKNHDRKELEEGYRFSANELAFVGCSGSGKTSLICRLIEHFSTSYRVGYVNHDAHGFDVDREGKDTWRANQSGAAEILINDETKSALLVDDGLDAALRGSLFESCDIVLVEGYRHSDIPKVVVLDAELEILEEVRSGAVSNIVAWMRPYGRAADLPAGLAPLFDADDTEGLAAFVLEMMQKRAAPVYGLVLGGGRSTRMGRDKAALDYHGIPQARYAANLLSGFCERTFVSVRAERAGDPLFDGIESIPDAFVGFGPMGGMLSAHHAHPKAAWLVLGCDLPFVSSQTLARLFAGRDPLKGATAYVRSEDGLPEPLCAIYEPPYRRRLLHFLAAGRFCPRKALINSRAKLLTLAHEWEIDNINDPAEYEEALTRIRTADPQSAGATLPAPAALVSAGSKNPSDSTSQTTRFVASAQERQA